MADLLVSTLLQVAIALLIAAGVWKAFRRQSGFFQSVGLTRVPIKVLGMGVAIGAIATALLLQFPSALELARTPGSVAAGLRFDGSGATVAAILLVALFKTSFSEELIFRGLIAKALIRRLGFGVGNALQAIAFGAVHILLVLIPGAQAAAVAMAVGFTAILGWINGWMNERLAGGSILPGWAAHGTANLLAYGAIAFGG